VEAYERILFLSESRLSTASDCQRFVRELGKEIREAESVPEVVSSDNPIAHDGVRRIGVRQLEAVADGECVIGALRVQPIERLIDGAKFIEVSLWTHANGGTSMYLGATEEAARRFAQALLAGADDFAAITKAVGRSGG